MNDYSYPLYSCKSQVISFNLMPEPVLEHTGHDEVRLLWFGAVFIGECSACTELFDVGIC